MHAFLIIDMQPAYFKDHALKAQLPGLVAAIEHYARPDDLIITVRTVHAADKTTWTLNMLGDDQGFAFEGSAEAGLLKELRLPPSIDITKTRDDAFYGTPLADILQHHSVDRLTIAGVSAHSCIFHTAATAYARNFAVHLLDNGIGDESAEQKRGTLDYLTREYRQKLTTS